MDIMEKTEQALVSLACIRLGYFTLPKIMDDKMYDVIMNERSRLERIFEHYWVTHIKMTDEYYSELMNWIRVNLAELRNPTQFLGDFTKPNSKERKYEILTQYSLDINREPRYVE